MVRGEGRNKWIISGEETAALWQFAMPQLWRSKSPRMLNEDIHSPLFCSALHGVFQEEEKIINLTLLHAQITNLPTESPPECKVLHRSTVYSKWLVWSHTLLSVSENDIMCSYRDHLHLPGISAEETLIINPSDRLRWIIFCLQRRESKSLTQPL